MAACLTYKRSTTTRLKAVGYLDLEHGTIITDDGEIDILESLRDFNGCPIDFSVTLKNEEDLVLPEGGD